MTIILVGSENFLNLMHTRLRMFFRDKRKRANVLRNSKITIIMFYYTIIFADEIIFGF